LHKFKHPIRDFLATVLFFKLHIFPRDGYLRSILCSLKK